MQSYKTAALSESKTQRFVENTDQININPSDQLHSDQAAKLKSHFPFLLEEDNEFLIAYFWLIKGFDPKDAIGRLDLSIYAGRKHWASVVTNLKQYCDAHKVTYRDLFPLPADDRYAYAA